MVSLEVKEQVGDSRANETMSPRIIVAPFRMHPSQLPYLIQGHY